MSDQSSESVERVSGPTPTDGRTEGRTQNLQDQGDHLTSLDAHEKSGRSPVAPYCAVPDHELYRAKNCQGCRSEFLETGTWPTGSLHAKATHAPAAPDARERAAGSTKEG